MERFLLRTNGGPCDGETRVANHQGRHEMDWPLPEVLKYDKTGYYAKVAESDIPPQPWDSPMLRGATYEWVQA